MKFVFRYAAYLTFAAAATILWLVFAFVAFNVVPFADPVCVREPGGCPQPSVIGQAIRVICILGAFPLTVLAFIPYRKAVRRALGLPETRSAQ